MVPSPIRRAAHALGRLLLGPEVARLQQQAETLSRQVAALSTSADPARMERLLVRVQRDVERIKLHTGAVLGPSRAVALLASGDRIFVDPRDRGCGMNLLTEGKYEEDEIQAFRRFLRPGITVLDVGANYGYYSIVSAPLVRPGGRVIAFEPNPHIHALLWELVYLNGYFDVVDPRRLGVYDSNGELKFQIDETGPGGAHVVGPEDRPGPEHRVIDVPVVALDDHLPPDQLVDLVKIDVEGHEEHALRGMRALIGRSPDIVIFMEMFYALFRHDEDFVRLTSFITEELGLQISRILAGGRTVAVRPEELRGQTCNVILSKHPLKPAPDLTIYPAQLHRGDGAQLSDDAIAWTQEAAGHARGELIVHGPYVYLPKGRYRLVIDADFEGAFTCRVQENFGDILWQGRIDGGQGYSAELDLIFDAPRLEIGLWAADGRKARLLLRRVEFWAL